MADKARETSPARCREQRGELVRRRVGLRRIRPWPAVHGSALRKRRHRAPPASGVSPTARREAGFPDRLADQPRSQLWQGGQEGEGSCVRRYEPQAGFAAARQIWTTPQQYARHWWNCQQMNALPARYHAHLKPHAFCPDHLTHAVAGMKVKGTEAWRTADSPQANGP